MLGVISISFYVDTLHMKNDLYAAGAGEIPIDKG